VLHYLNPPVRFETENNRISICWLKIWCVSLGIPSLGDIFNRRFNIGICSISAEASRILISSSFYPLLGNRTKGWIGQTIEIPAVLATCTGVATTFGLSALQMWGGLSHLTPIPNSIWTQITVINIVTFCFIISSSSGLNKGIKVLKLKTEKSSDE